MNNRQYLLIGLSVLMAIPSSCPLAGSNDNTKQPFSNGNVACLKLVYTEQEYTETKLDQWEDIVELARAAYGGHRGAMFVAAYSRLQKIDAAGVSTIEPINEEFVTLISMSASLGFAPALDLLAKLYMTPDYNPYLGMVYLSLCVELGHAELIPLQLGAREEFLRLNGGDKVLQEIDRILQEKMAIIRDNCEKLQASTDPFFAIKSLTLVTSEDAKYEVKYWRKLRNSDDVSVA